MKRNIEVATEETATRRMVTRDRTEKLEEWLKGK